ncbi:hypothetical protein [Ornithinimicrobium sp. LYQ103]|uniref:hypothetical protein n=1 Tax=Ornithinimicrobium sp. LYQ103 TaxID=3378796 RepID=UPI0038529854
MVDVVLGHADDAVRDGVLAHLGRCEACRGEYDALAAGLELVLPAVPRVQPPAGFSATVLRRLDDERVPGARPPGRRTVLVAAAAALLGLVTGAGVTVLSRDPATRADPWAAPLLTADGSEVGSVTPAYGEQGAVLVVTVTGGRTGRRYTCRLVLADGRTDDVAEWSLAADRPGTWVVDQPRVEVDRVELVAESGAVWSVAQL